jgi:hypothetical protein
MSWLYLPDKMNVIAHKNKIHKQLFAYPERENEGLMQ